jgi:hypothetical protein
MKEVVSAATAVIGKGGTVVITGLANPAKLTVHISGTDLTLHEKTIRGSLFGSCNPQSDIVRLLRLYDAGQLMLDELVTATYTLEQVNQGYQDLRDGKTSDEAALRPDQGRRHRRGDRTVARTPHLEPCPDQRADQGPLRHVQEKEVGAAIAVYRDGVKVALQF